MSTTMKAFVRTNSITQEVEFQNVRIPENQADEVLIKVKAFASWEYRNMYALRFKGGRLLGWL